MSRSLLACLAAPLIALAFASGARCDALVRPVAELPLGVTSFGAAVDGGFVYVLGGYFGKPHDYRAEFQSRAFYRIDRCDPRRVELLPNDDALQSVALVAWNGKIVRVGGMVVGEHGPESITDCAAFDTATRAWTALPPLPEPRSSHDATVVGDTLYVVGGWALGPDVSGDGAWHDRMFALDLAHPDAGWRELPQPFTKRGIAAVALNGKLFVIGGMTSDHAPSTSVESFDPATGEWSSGPAYPGKGFGVSAASIDGRLVASGSDGTVWSLAAGSTAWQKEGALLFPRFFHRIVAVGAHELLALGGIGAGDVRPRHVESIALSTDAPAANAAIVAHWTIANPLPAKNRQGVFLRGDSLWLFGGNDSLGQHDFGPEHFRAEAVKVNLPTLACTRLADFPVHRQTMQTEQDASGAIGVAIGGFGNDGAESEDAHTFADAFAYDFAKDAWSPFAATLPEPRSQFGLVRNGEKLFVFGGLDFDPARGGDDRFHYPLRVLSTSIGAGAAFSDAGVELPCARRAFAGALLDGRYYLVGGMKGEFQPVESCDVFDFASGAWSTIASPARPRISGQLVALDGRLFLAGGSSRAADGKIGPDPALETFDPKTGAWTTLLDIPVAPSQLRMFAWRGHLLMVSTHDSERPVLHLVVVRPGDAPLARS